MTWPAAAAGRAPRTRTARTRDAGEELVVRADDARPVHLPVDHVRQQRAPRAAVVRSCHLRLATHGGVDHRAGVDLTVRVRVGGADDGTPVLEDQDVRHAVLGLEHLRAGAPRGHDGHHLVVGEVGHGAGGIVVIADDLRRAERPPRAVHVVVGSGRRCVGREHREVVGEDVHAPVVRVRAAQPTTARRQGVVVGYGRLSRSHDLADPRSCVPMRGEEDPLATERMPAQLPGHGRRSSPSGARHRSRPAAPRTPPPRRGR